MSTERESSANHSTSNTTSVQILGGIEALLFVLVGVIAVRFQSLALVLSLAALVCALLLIRWLNAAPLRKEEASAYLMRRYELRSVLLDDLQEILGRAPHQERWDLGELVERVDWWFYEDLYSDWLADQDYLRRANRGTKRQRVQEKMTLRSRVMSARYNLIRKLEGIVTSRMQLIDAVHRAGYEELARLVLARALEEGFVVEQLETSGHRAKITYSLSDSVRPTDGSR